MSVRLPLIAIAIVFMGVGPVSPVAAADREVALQLRSMTLPAISAKGLKGKTSLTPYVVLSDIGAVPLFCGKLVEISPVLAADFTDDPIQLAAIAEDLSARRQRLQEIVQLIAGARIVKDLQLVQGSKTRGAGTELMDVPGGNAGCQPIKYLPWTRHAEAPMQLPPPTKSAGTVAVQPIPPAEAPSAPPSLSDNFPNESEEQLTAEYERRKAFSASPSKIKPPPMIVIVLMLSALAGLMLILGSYIGYRVAKARRERRRKDRRHNQRRMAKRRNLADAAPPAAERRGTDDRREPEERRVSGRRDDADRRDG